MHCFDSGFVIVCVIIGFVFINCENEIVKDESQSEIDEDITPEDLYSFVALIDLVFIDGMKKTCTGTIIHDYVVITTAHCFQIDDDNIIQAELTASFVVIGTKKMFDTGYEQYLPIERVIIHPKYNGWTADLALVYTFAGMMSDKPGLIVPLASEKTITPVDSDVTVFSWGQFKINSHTTSTVPLKNKKKTDEDRYESLDGRIARIDNKKVTSYIQLQSSTEEDIEQFLTTSSQKIETTKTSPKPNKRRQKKRKHKKRIRQRKQTTEDQAKYHLTQSNHQSSTEIRSKYRQQPLRYRNSAIFDNEAQVLNWEKRKVIPKRLYMKVPTTENYRSSGKWFRATSYYRKNKNRRKMGVQKNKLAVETFGFVNMQTCKKLIEKAMPSPRGIKNLNEVVCYASEAHFVTEEDSGAPAMRRGRLVAVTVGGANFDGERVAVGLKMTCFCSWISDNLPISGTKLQCCKNCCEAKQNTEHNPQFRHAHYIKTRSKK